MEILILITLLGVGYFFGSRAEKNHYKDLRLREKKLLSFPVEAGTFKEVISEGEGFLVSGHVVIGSDYFKTFASGLKSLVGGNLSNFERVIDRGRREAILRMKEEANSLGAYRIVNLRLETARIGSNSSGKGALPCVEVHAYGTALKK